MKILLFLFCLNFYGLSSFAKSVAISESDLPEWVKKGNALIKAGQSEVASYKANTGHLARSFIPKVSVLAGQESFKYVSNQYNTQPYFGAEIELNLYNGGRDSLKNKIDIISLEKGKSLQKINRFTQLEDARRTFWTAVYFKKLITQYDLALALTRKNKRAAIKRIRGGVATQSDQFEFDIKETELQQDKKRAQLSLEKELSRLKILIGLELEQTLILNQTLTHNHNWRKLLKHSEDDHHYLITPLELEVEKFSLTSKLSNRSWYPKLDAYALWLQNNQRGDFDRINEAERQQTAFGIRATWGLSKIFSGKAQSKSAKALEESNKHRYNFKKRELEIDLHLELKELELLDSMVHDAEENIKRSKRFFKLITSEYKRGVKTSGDMLMATEKLITSEVRIMKIIKDFHLARAHILTKLGQ